MADPGPILEGLKPVLVQIALAQSWGMSFVLGAKGKKSVEVPGWAARSQGPGPGQQGPGCVWKEGCWAEKSLPPRPGQLCSASPHGRAHARPGHSWARSLAALAGQPPAGPIGIQATPRSE